MKGLFSGKSMYGDAIAAQEREAKEAKVRAPLAGLTAEQRKDQEKKEREAAEEAEIEAEWLEESRRMEAEDDTSLDQEWAEHQAAALSGEQDEAEFSEFKRERATRKAEQLEQAKKEFVKSRKKLREDKQAEQRRQKEEADKLQEELRASEREARWRARNAADQNSTLELDDEDEALLAGIKKGGYCYFAEDSAKAKAGLEALGETQAPQRISSPTAEQTSQGGSAWNAKGTTFEERDHSSWASGRLKQAGNSSRQSEPVWADAL